jgi:hypothetical protein
LGCILGITLRNSKKRWDGMVYWNIHDAHAAQRVEVDNFFAKSYDL